MKNRYLISALMLTICSAAFLFAQASENSCSLDNESIQLPVYNNSNPAKKGKASNKDTENTTNNTNKYIPDAVLLISSEKEFNEAGVTAEDLAKVLGEIVIDFNKDYKMAKNKGAVDVYLEISAIKQPKQTCDSAPGQCVLMSYHFEDNNDTSVTSNPTQSMLEIFQQDVLKIKEVRMPNNSYKGKLRVIIHLNYPVEKEDTLTT